MKHGALVSEILLVTGAVINLINGSITGLLFCIIIAVLIARP